MMEAFWMEPLGERRVVLVLEELRCQRKVHLLPMKDTEGEPAEWLCAGAVLSSVVPSSVVLWRASVVLWREALSLDRWRYQRLAPPILGERPASAQLGKEEMLLPSPMEVA